jgi:adenylosuccinate lyase
MTTEPMSYGLDTYLCVMTWRYGSETMRQYWSLIFRALTQRDVWIANAVAQKEAGLATTEQVEDMRRVRDDVVFEEIRRIEKMIHHDIMAGKQHYQEQIAEQATADGQKIVHKGMTSEDNTSNLDMIILRLSLDLIIERVETLLKAFLPQIEHYAELRCPGFTHIQSAVTTTVGYRFAGYAQSLKNCLIRLRGLRPFLLGKGLKGATGTRSSFKKMLADKDLSLNEFEEVFLKELGLPGAHTITGQTYPREVDLMIHNNLSELTAVLHKFALDMRILQSSPINEMQEPFSKTQKGSSAMSWKKNPILAENLCSLCRIVASLCSTSWMNAANSILDRTLDESANRRLTLPLGFLTVDQALMTATKMISQVVVKEKVINRNLHTFGVFAGIEHLLIHLHEEMGLDRDEMYDLLKAGAFAAQTEYEETGQMHLAHYIYQQLHDIDPELGLADVGRILEEGLMDVGDAPERALQLIDEVNAVLDEEVSIV